MLKCLVYIIYIVPEKQDFVITDFTEHKFRKHYVKSVDGPYKGTLNFVSSCSCTASCGLCAPCWFWALLQGGLCQGSHRNRLNVFLEQ